LREEFVCSRWISTHEDKACKNITNCTNVTLKKILEYIYSELNSNWRIRGFNIRLRLQGKRNMNLLNGLREEKR
jgi:hypothetical protein